MSRLITLLLLYQNGFLVGKYISIERLIEKTKDHYYNALQKSSHKWLENENDVLPFIKYMLQIIIAAYRDFDSRILIPSEKKLNKGNMIKDLFDHYIGKISKADIKKLLPNISEPMIEIKPRDLVKTNYIKKVGSGKNTAYVKAH